MVRGLKRVEFSKSGPKSVQKDVSIMLRIKFMVPLVFRSVRTEIHIYRQKYIYTRRHKMFHHQLSASRGFDTFYLFNNVFVNLFHIGKKIFDSLDN